MKQLLSIVVLAFAFAASATDQYFYWMIGESVEIDGTPHSSSKYYAKIKADGATDYLSLYAQPEMPVSAAFDHLTYDTGDDCPKVFANLGSSPAAKYLVELYSDLGANPIGYADLFLSDLSDYITSGGMGTTGSAGAYAVSDFSSVPEPTSGLLFLLGVAGLALRRRKMQRA